MRKPEVRLVDLSIEAGPPPENVDLATWLIAELPPLDLKRAARYEVPTYEALEEDKRRGGTLLKSLDENPHPEKALGEEVLLRQQRLARAKRRLVTTVCALTLFAGTAGYTEYAKQSIGPVSSTPNGPKVEDRPIDWDGDAIAGSVGGLAGGFISYFIALGQSHRLAVRPAKRIVRKAKKEAK